MQEKYRGTSTAENTTDTGLPVRDADMAKELIKLIKASVLTETAEFMLAQANISIEGVARLLRTDEIFLRS